MPGNTTGFFPRCIESHQPVEAGYAKHIYHIYAVRVKQRDRIMAALAEKGISCGIHYPVPVHLQDAYGFLGLKAGNFPVAETCAEEFLSLPMFPELKAEQIAYVADTLSLDPQVLSVTWSRIVSLSIIDPIDFPRWNESLRSLPGHTFFHTSSWADVLHRSYGYKPVYFTIWEGDTLSALLPCMDIDSVLTGKRGVCLPFTDYGEPLVSDSGQFEELFAAAVAFGKKRNWRTLEIRGGETFFQGKEPSEWFFGHNRGTAPLFPENPENRGAVLLFRDSTRRNIKKAEKEGITATISTSPDSMEAFCRLNAMTRKDHGLPPQPRHFFQHVQERIISKDMGFIVLGSYRGAAIAANVYFHFGDQVIYKYGASDKTYQHLRANNLVMWEAIKWACDKGYKTLSFGRTEPENQGLRQFKAGWGAQETLIKYYRYDLQKEAFVKAPKIVNPYYKKLFSKLPIPALNMLGRILYRHMG